MFAPNVKNVTLGRYMSYYCRDVLAEIAAKVTRELEPVNAKDRLLEYVLPSEPSEPLVSVVVDTDSDRPLPFNEGYFEAASDPVQRHIRGRMEDFEVKHSIESTAYDLAKFISAVEKWDPDIAKRLRAGVQAAFSTDSFLKDCLRSIGKEISDVESWVDRNNQVLVYNGEEQSMNTHTLRPFIAGYLNVFKMDGHLVLEHNGSAKTMVRKSVPGGHGVVLRRYVLWLRDGAEDR
jgi:hypothetical protein